MKDLIAELGGPTAVANKLKLSISCVGNWGKRGIPWRWRIRIAEMATEKGVKVPANFLEAA